MSTIVQVPDFSTVDPNTMQIPGLPVVIPGAPGVPAPQPSPEDCYIGLDGRPVCGTGRTTTPDQPVPTPMPSNRLPGWVVPATLAAGVVTLMWLMRRDDRRQTYAPNRRRRYRPNTTDKVRLVRVRLNRGGYDSRGRYFGVGAPLYRFETDDGEIHGYVRARDRQHARLEVLKRHPQARMRRNDGHGEAPNLDDDHERDQFMRDHAGSHSLRMQYARLKELATAERLGGNIEVASRLEHRADLIYKRLPRNQRW